MIGERSYGDPCGIARALDRIGERWALLVVRELLLGPKRFSDLRTALSGISPNVLSQRLRELETTGVLLREKLPPPAGSFVYVLTEVGRELQPVLLALGSWGSHLPVTGAGVLSVDALLLALMNSFDADAAGLVNEQFELHIGEERFRLEIEQGRLELGRGRCEHPVAVIEADVATLRALVFGGGQLQDALGSGALSVEGDRRSVTHLLRAFR
jgi:DNA-binding HxlR family transcriptional regulator